MNPQEIVAVLRDAIAGGGTDRRLIGLGLIAVIAVIGLVGAYVYYITSPKAKLRAVLESREVTSERAPAWGMRIAIVMLMLAAFFGANLYIEKPSTCAQCHRSSPQMKAIAGTAHKDVSCMGCHRPPGVTAYLRQDLTFLRWVTVYGITKQPPVPRGASVESAACLRCHWKVTTGVAVRSGIRVRHSDFLDKGAQCARCHNATAHGDSVANPTKPEMNACVECHDGKQASSECSTCHVKDLAQRPSSRGYSKLQISDQWNSCYRCHDEKPCTRCHGVIMPHPPGWSSRQEAASLGGEFGRFHARDGFTDREVCWRCHYAKGKPFVPANEGCSCHGLFGGMHGGAAWVKEHGLQATGQTSGGNSQCFFCHSTNFCDLCHPRGYEKRYAPSGAAPRTPGYAEPPPADDW